MKEVVRWEGEEVVEKVMGCLWEVGGPSLILDWDVGGVGLAVKSCS